MKNNTENKLDKMKKVKVNYGMYAEKIQEKFYWLTKLEKKKIKFLDEESMKNSEFSSFKKHNFLTGKL